MSNLGSSRFWMWPLKEGQPLGPPRLPAVSPAPKAEDKAVQEAAAEAARRRQRARGFRSTILSQEFLSPGRETLGS